MLLLTHAAQKMKFSIKDFFSKCDSDLVTFTEKIFNVKLHCNPVPAVGTRRKQNVTKASSQKHQIDRIKPKMTRS